MCIKIIVTKECNNLSFENKQINVFSWINIIKIVQCKVKEDIVPGNTKRGSIKVCLCLTR